MNVECDQVVCMYLLLRRNISLCEHFSVLFVSLQCSVVVTEWAWWFEPSQHLSTARLLASLRAVREEENRNSTSEKTYGSRLWQFSKWRKQKEGGKKKKKGKGWCSHHFLEAVCVVADSHQNTFPSGFIAEHDVVWHGLPLWLVCVCCPSTSLFPPPCTAWACLLMGTEWGGKKKPWHFAKAKALVCYQLCFSHKHKTLHRAGCTVKNVKSIPARPCVWSILLTFYSSP